MKLDVLLLIIFGLFHQIVSLKSEDEQWEAFKKKFNKSYENLEQEEYRRAIFVASLRTITEHNARFQNGRVKYEMRIPSSADMSSDEILKLKTGYQASGLIKGNTFKLPLRDEKDLPENLDWKIEGLVTSVKNQGLCGSCWVFAMCASIEGQLIKNKLATQSVDLSEQQLIDCAKTTSASGCEGGDPLFVFLDLRNSLAGVTGESTYRYKATQRTCRRYLSAENYYIKDVMYYRKSVPNEPFMKEASAILGPLSAGIAATENFLRYKSGIFSSDELCTEDYGLNHAITITGYGVDADGTKFWIIKNSWGTGWGEKGFGKIERGKGLCKIGTDFVVPLIKEGSGSFLGK